MTKRSLTARSYPVRVPRVPVGPLTPTVLDECSRWLSVQGYSPGSAAGIVNLLERLSVWMQVVGAGVDDIGEELLGRFVVAERSRDHERRGRVAGFGDAGTDAAGTVDTDLVPVAVIGHRVLDALEVRQDVAGDVLLQRVEVDREEDPRARLESVVEGGVDRRLPDRTPERVVEVIGAAPVRLVDREAVHAVPRDGLQFARLDHLSGRTLLTLVR